MERLKKRAESNGQHRSVSVDAVDTGNNYIANVPGVERHDN